MLLNNLFTPKNKRTATEYFLAVEIHESLIKSAVWQVEDEKPSLVSLGSYELWDSEDSLINGIDASLTEATKGLAVPPDRVIFGLPDSWLVENKIHSTKQKLIQHLLKELKLKPIGLVTISEAIIQQLKVQEGVPPTAILLEIYSSKIIVSLVNIGQIQVLEEVGRSDDLARDVEEGLARFEVDKLPARFILTNGSDLENEEQQIISYPWTDKLPFLHLPKVQALPIDFSIKAIALSGGSEAAKSLGLPIAETQVETPLVEETPAPDDQLAEIGFSAESETILPETEIIPEDVIESPVELEDLPRPTLLSRLSRLKFRPNLYFLSQIHFAPSRRLALIAIPVFLILVISGITAYYFLLGTAQINLSLTPKQLSQDLDLTITSGDKSDILVIQATKKSISGKSSSSVSTSGEAVVGEKAIGKVTINNYTSQPLSLKVGTKVAYNNLVFTLDSAASIASSSTAIQDNGDKLTSPGRATVALTATKIGAEYNLDKGVQLSVSDNPKSNVVAISDANLSGGSTRTVKAVAKADQEKVLGVATDKIKSEISDQLKQQDPDSRFVSLGDLHYSTKNFDHGSGEEASTLSLDLEGQQEVLIYSYRQMIDAISQKIKSSIDSGLTMSDRDLQISLSDPVTKGDNSFVSKAHIEALLLPAIDSSRIIEQTKGRNVEVLKSILRNIPGYRVTSLLITPQIPFLMNYLPANAQKIRLNISATP